MPRTYLQKARSYTEEDLQKALTLIRQGKLSIRTAAKTFRIDKSKLSRCLNNKHNSRRGRKQVLSKEQETDLTHKIEVMAKWGFALSKEEIKSIVQTYVNENNLATVFKDGKPGDDWFRMFCKRNRLSQKKMEQLEKCRRTATSDPFIIYSFYDRLKETISQLGLQDKPSHIFNLDETSFNLDPGRVKGIAVRGQRVHRRIEGSGKENITTMACISACGVLLPQLIIFQGQNLWSTWKGTNDLKDTCYAVSDKGWMTTAVFNSWFIKFCTMIPQRPLLIIMDGHVSHLDKGTIEHAIQNNITLFKLPPHATDLLQPLDKCCFGPLKLKSNQTLIEWQRLNQRRLTKSEFADMICALWNEGITEAVIKKSFESPGIFPCCREKYPKDRLNAIKLQKYNEGSEHTDPLDIYALEQQGTDKEKEQEEADQIRQDSEIENKEPENTINGAAIGEVTANISTNNLHPIHSTPSTSSTSFESIILSKINKSNPEIKRRRKIDSNCTVLTSLEYLNRIKEKEALQNKKKKPRNNATAPSIVSSSESDTEVVYADESDIEDMTLEELVKDDHFSDEEIFSSDIVIGDYILVKFHTKKKVLHYVALVENVEENEFAVSYLRRKGDKFVFPQAPEKFNVSTEDVVTKLPAPTFHGGTARVSQQIVFGINFDKYSIVM